MCDDYFYGRNRQYSSRSSHVSYPPSSDPTLDAMQQQQQAVDGIASNAVRNQQRAKFFDASSTSDKGRYRVHDARSGRVY
jgi:hypothetical protein